jgi:hypothetical protein
MNGPVMSYHRGGFVINISMKYIITKIDPIPKFKPEKNTNGLLKINRLTALSSLGFRTESKNTMLYVDRKNNDGTRSVESVAKRSPSESFIRLAYSPKKYKYPRSQLRRAIVKYCAVKFMENTKTIQDELKSSWFVGDFQFSLIPIHKIKRNI